MSTVVKPGYKQTEVGVIPEEWDVLQIRDVCQLVNGRGFKPHEWKTVGIPIIRIQNLNGSEDFNFYSGQYTPKILVEHGQLLFAWSGSRGTSFGPHVWSGGRALLNYHTWKVVVNESKVTPDFLLHALRQITSYIENKAHGASALVHTQKWEMEKFPIVIPAKLPEQCAIAEALSDVDALLDGLDRLITKKRDLKQAAMQQLLTGQTRLPGFNGEWKVKRLGNLFKFSGGYSASRDQLSAEGHCYLHYGDIHGASKTTIDTRADYQDIPKLDISLKRVSSDSLLADGDVVFVDASEDDEGTSKHVVVVNGGNVPFIAGLHTIVAKARTSELAHEYRRYCFQTTAIKQQFLFYAVGTKVSGISKTNIAKLTLPVPSLPEQTAIAAIFSDMDAELVALEARRDKTRALKQAMMQELLTGKTRLVKSNVIAFPTQSARVSTRKNNVYFTRSVFAAEIIDRLHDEPTFGHVKCEKIIFLAERMCKVDTGSHYHRDAAGPYDNRALRSIDNQLRNQKWFDVQKVGERYQYIPMEKRGGHMQYFGRYFSKVSTTFDRVIRTFKTAKTEQCEIVATLYSAWDDLLHQQAAVSDDAILREVLDNWHESKKRIPEDRWRKALGWMKQKGFTPEGASHE